MPGTTCREWLERPDCPEFTGIEQNPLGKSCHWFKDINKPRVRNIERQNPTTLTVTPATNSSAASRRPMGTRYAS